MIAREKRPSHILVVSDQRGEAISVQQLLEGEYDNVSASFDPTRAVDDFQEVAPDVLLLAFDRIEKAQQYYLGLYRFGAAMHEHPHRTIVLCSKDEVKNAFELCRRQYFDDYVLFWPAPYDGSRLFMSIHVAIRELNQTREAGVTDHHLQEYARRLVQFKDQLGDRLKEGAAEMGEVSESWTQAERHIGNAIGQLAEQLEEGRFGAAINVNDSASLRNQLQYFSDENILPFIDSGRGSVAQLEDWAKRLENESTESMDHASVLLDLIDQTPRRILLVEDDEFSQRMVGHMLESEGFETIFAASGTEALTLLRRIRPALILMDVRLPGLDGVEVTRRLKSTPQFADIPVIMLTGHSDRDTVVASRAVGAVDFIVKPVSLSALTAKINRYFLAHKRTE